MQLSHHTQEVLLENSQHNKHNTHPQRKTSKTSLNENHLEWPSYTESNYYNIMVTNQIIQLYYPYYNKLNKHTHTHTEKEISCMNTYIYVHTHTHRHIYIYIYIYIERERERERERYRGQRTVEIPILGVVEFSR
jgi:hypothetical protein